MTEDAKPAKTVPADLIIRDAMASDLPSVVRLLADDVRGKKRERVADPLPQPYADAFAAITADSRSKLIVAEHAHRVVGTMQLTFIPGLSQLGSERLLLEAIYVASDMRKQGIGEAMIRWAVDAAKARGCRFIMVTSHKSRRLAHKFYKHAGFHSSHIGFKFEIE